MFAGICKHYYKAPSFFLQPLFPVIYSHPCFGWCTVCVELKLIWRWEHYQGQFIIRVGKTWTPYRIWSVFFLMEPWWSCYSTRWISLNTIRCCFGAQWGLMEHTQNINQRDICEISICSRSTSPFTPVLFHPWLSGASLSPLACPQPLLCRPAPAVLTQTLLWVWDTPTHFKDHSRFLIVCREYSKWRLHEESLYLAIVLSLVYRLTLV